MENKLANEIFSYAAVLFYNVRGIEMIIVFVGQWF